MVPSTELPDGVEAGIRYLTYNFDAPRFIVFLKQHLAGLGVTFVRRRVEHLDAAFEYDLKTEVVFNCTGLGARTLAGVADEHVYPTRGQIVLVRAPHVHVNRCRWGPDFCTYIIPRPCGQGLVVLGGFQQRGNWSGATYADETKDILRRCTQLMPELVTGNPRLTGDGQLEIVREAAGLRPSRVGGPRIEREVRSIGSGATEKKKKKKLVIHNYGASGTGYQAGLGMAMEAVALLEEKAML